VATVLPRPAAAGPGLVPPQRLRDRLDVRSLVVLGVLLLATTTLQVWGLARSPQRIDDEGTYVAQAWAVLHLGDLTHYTYWYDHPPLGWLQLAGFFGLTGVVELAPNAVVAGRIAMVVVQAVSVVLLWTVGRRLQFSRWASALVVVLFSVSPLALQYHRTVYLDNIATPWILATFVLLLSPRRSLAAFAGAGLTFAVAVLTKETSLLLFPVVAWVFWQRTGGESGTRRYALAVSGTVFALAGAFYVLFAAVKGELVPGPGHTSLWEGVTYQLGGRESSGVVWEAGTLGNRTLTIWLALDHVLPVLACVVAPLGLFVRRVRPFAVGLTLLLLVLLRPGYLPVPYVIGVLPLVAIVGGGVAQAAVTRVRSARRAGRRGSAVLVALVLGIGATVSAASAATTWPTELRGLTIAPLDAPVADAETWIHDNVPDDARLLVDDSLWVDLVRDGRSRDDVVWYYKPDTDEAVVKGWQNYDWIVTSDSVRSDPTSFPTVQGALENSTAVAQFGTGERRVEVRRIGSVAQAGDAAELARTTRSQAGTAVAANPLIGASDRAADTLRGGLVDPRLMTVLTSIAARTGLTVSEFPAVPGEDAAGGVRRTAVLGSTDPQGLRAALLAQRGAYLPASVLVRGQSVTVQYPLP
jgi:hypothetical protein